MKLLFIHQNMPGQFKHIVPLLAGAGHEVVFLTKPRAVRIKGVRKVAYKPHRAVRKTTHPYMRQFEGAVLHGQGIARACLELSREGFTPDLIIAHPGWGETLFVKEVWPNAPLLSYCEYYYSVRGADFAFDPAFRATFDDQCKITARNAHLLLSLQLADRGWSPTEWQKSRHPQVYQSKITTIFDGIDTFVAKPNPQATFDLPDGKVLTRDDEVITYVARNLEPYRGFRTFMKALPDLLKARPKAQVLIAGAEGVSYGSAPKDGRTWQEVMTAEINLDGNPHRDRVHFLGHLAYDRYMRLLQVSSAHIYLTYPFVLSWSFMEAMAAGCLMIGSDTAPVREVLRHGENGYLTDFFDAPKLVETVVTALEEREAGIHLRAAGRNSIIGRYDLQTCLPRQLELIEQMSGKLILPASR